MQVLLPILQRIGDGSTSEQGLEELHRLVSHLLKSFALPWVLEKWRMLIPASCNLSLSLLVHLTRAGSNFWRYSSSQQGSQWGGLIDLQNCLSKEESVSFNRIR